MPKVEDGEKVNRSSKGRVKKEGGGEGVGVMRARGLRCFRGSRVARNLHFNLLSFRFHHYPPPQHGLAGTQELSNGSQTLRIARKLP